jgi:hypothetical protein
MSGSAVLRILLIFPYPSRVDKFAERSHLIKQLDNTLLVTLYTYYTLKLYRITTLQLMGGITFQFQQSSD